MTIDKELVFEIVRNHFSKEDLLKRHLRYSHIFNTYFKENCYHKDIIILRQESSLDGTIELFQDISDFLLSHYGYVYDSHYAFDSWSRYGRAWKYAKTIDALLLPNNNVLIDKDKILDRLYYGHGL